MLTLEMMPALFGDCLWIEYGDERAPHRVLIDCGLKSTYRAVAERLRDRPDLTFELLVLTHIDADHIHGSIPLLQEFGPERFRDVWFNGWKHLPPDDRLGPVQGEIVSALLETRGFTWNGAWGGRAVVAPEEGELPQRTLPGGLKLTLLSPTPDRLTALRKVWNTAVREEKLEPGAVGDALRILEQRKSLQPDRLGAKLDVERLAATPYEPDDGEANGSSIALLAEHEGKALLLAGDAFAPLLETTVGRLLAERGKERLRLDAFKLSHHGSRGNTSPGLLQLVSCPRFLISTNGSNYHHPHPETIARVLTSQRAPRLYFNYRSEENTIWDDPDLQRNPSYEACYPDRGTAGYRLVL
jgi:beta-lactamase superfamily II metal-dependent hydrolase